MGPGASASVGVSRDYTQAGSPSKVAGFSPACPGETSIGVALPLSWIHDDSC